MNRQHKVSANLLESMRKDGFPEGYKADELMRCSYCQAIYKYVYSEQGREPKLLGHYNNDILGPGWKPSKCTKV